jgi:hypothetical protein
MQLYSYFTSILVVDLKIDTRHFYVYFLSFPPEVGHSSMLHAEVSMAVQLSHSATDSEHKRSLDLIPPPQVLLHSVHPPHSEHSSQLSLAFTSDGQEPKTTRVLSLEQARSFAPHAPQSLHSLSSQHSSSLHVSLSLADPMQSGHPVSDDVEHSRSLVRVPSPQVLLHSVH